MNTTCASATCLIGPSWEMGETFPLRGSVKWAESQIVLSGIVKRRTKLKNLSSKRIAAIVERMVDAEEWRDNHECEVYYRDDY